MTSSSKRSGRLGNKNGLRHGAYLQRFDGRTAIGRSLSHVEIALVQALGGDPTPQQILILQRAALKAVRCGIAERQILSLNGNAPRRLEQDYLRWARELREDLKSLGLRRQAKPVQDLQTYVKNQYGS